MIYAGFASSQGFVVGGQSYSNFLASAEGLEAGGRGACCGRPQN